MDDLINQLRDANPEPRPDPLPIGPIWDRLDRLGHHPRGRLLPRRLAPGRMVGGLPVVFALAVSVLVVVVIGLSAGTHRRASSGSSGSAGVCSLPARPGELTAVKAILSQVQLLRQPTGAQDESPAACTAQADIEIDPVQVPTDPGYKLTPVDLRYVGPGVLGGKVFMYAIPGAPRTIAYSGVPANSGLARSEVQPAVCFITVGGKQTALPSGCTNLATLRAGPKGFAAAQIPGTTTSMLAGVVRDGITAVRVYDRGKLVTTVPVHHNMVQFIVDHNSPAAVYLRIVPVVRQSQTVTATTPQSEADINSTQTAPGVPTGTTTASSSPSPGS